jgi:hypothetical protein
MQIRDDGVLIQQMEESRVAMTVLFVPKVYFKELKYGDITELRLGVQDMKGILNRLNRGDVITFTLSPNGKLHVEIKGKRVRVFEMPFFEPEEIERRVPKVVFNVRVKTTIEGIVSAIEGAKKLGGKKADEFSTITFTTVGAGLKIESMTGDGLYSTYVMLTPGWDLIKLEGSTDQRVTVGIAYIADVITAISSVTNVVQIEYSTDFPLHVIAELPLKGVNVEYYLAPRIL